MGKWPALAGDVTQIADFESDFFTHLSVHALLDRLARLDETGQGAVDPGGEARRACQQQLVAAADQHDDARRQARVMVQLAGRADHRPLAGKRLQRPSAAAAEAVLARPGRDLGGIAKHAESRQITFVHELAQAFPETAGEQVVRVVRQLEHADRLAVEIADAVLGKHHGLGQVRLQPGPRKEDAAGVTQELLPAMRQRPTSGLAGVDDGRLPEVAAGHQAATCIPSARTLSAARSSTS
ncbi:hypothetical protein D9M71_389050 [compost metagenome]